MATSTMFNGAPVWYLKSSTKELPKPCLKITLTVLEQTHDGYCSDHEELKTTKKVSTVYSTIENHNILETSSWEDEVN
jgi:hypothetical protein